MKCNYKSAEWYGEKHPEPEDLYIYKIKIKINSIDFGFEKVGSLHGSYGIGIIKESVARVAG